METDRSEVHGPRVETIETEIAWICQIPNFHMIYVITRNYAIKRFFPI